MPRAPINAVFTWLLTLTAGIHGVTNFTCQMSESPPNAIQRMIDLNYTCKVQLIKFLSVLFFTAVFHEDVQRVWVKPKPSTLQ